MIEKTFFLLQIKSIPSLKDHMKLFPGSVTYHGPKDLLELDVRNISIRSDGLDHVFVEIKLKRRCLFHLATTYFPSLCLFIISEILLFMNEEHFEATIMVSLTAMLVMYTLHQSILTQLPKTSYMKYIDFWFMWHVISVFFIIAYHIVLDRIREYFDRNEINQNQVIPFKKLDDDAGSLNKDSRQKIHRINDCLIIVFPAVNGIFYAIYFVLTLDQKIYVKCIMIVHKN